MQFVILIYLIILEESMKTILFMVNLKVNPASYNIDISWQSASLFIYIFLWRKWTRLQASD